VYSADGQRIRIKTYVRAAVPISNQLRETLQRAMQDQDQLLEHWLRGKRSLADTRRRMQRIQNELEHVIVVRHADGEQERHLGVPLPNAALDLVLRIPRRMGLTARTFSGEISVVRVDGGMDLSTEGGAVRVRRARGQITSYSQYGAQELTDVQGPVKVSGVSGSVVLRRIRGSVSASLIDGTIDARRVDAKETTFRTVRGGIHLERMRGPGNHLAATRTGLISIHRAKQDSFRFLGLADRWQFGSSRIDQLKRTDRQAEGRVGRGSATVTLSSPKGGIVIR
jgi:hypothetical protein